MAASSCSTGAQSPSSAKANPEEFGGKSVTIVGFKTLAKAVPVTAAYSDLKTWWRGDTATNGRGA